MTAMTDTTCNGWSNYATWRVNLELADDILQSLDTHELLTRIIPNAGTERIDLADYLKDQCEEIVTESDTCRAPYSANDPVRGNTLAAQYALAFLGQVNWWEIADNFLRDNPELLLTDDSDDN